MNKMHNRLGSFRRVLAAVLVLTLGMATGCKKKPKEEQETASGQTGVNSDISYLPQDVFGPAAVPGATVLKLVDIHSFRK